MTNDRNADDNPRMEKGRPTIDPTAHDDRTFRPFVPDRMTKRRHTGHAPNQVLHDVLSASSDTDTYLSNVNLLASHDHSQREREGAIRYHVQATLENTGMGTPLLGASIVGDLVDRGKVAITDAEALDGDTLRVDLRPIETTVEPVEIEYGDLPADVKTHAEIVNTIDSAFGGEIPEDVARGVELMKAELTDGEFGDENPFTGDESTAQFRADALGEYEIAFDGREIAGDYHIIDKENDLFSDHPDVSAYPAVCGENGAWSYPPSQDHSEYDAHKWCKECLGTAKVLGHVAPETDGGFDFDFPIHEQ